MQALCSRFTPRRRFRPGWFAVLTLPCMRLRQILTCAVIALQLRCIFCDYALIPKLATWSYCDNGTDQISLGYYNASYDSSLWPVGRASLGFGFTDTVTNVSYGRNSSNKYVTTFFRSVIPVWDVGTLAAPINISVNYVHGVRCFLNGVEVLRKNMPSGNIGYTTPASGSLTKSTQIYPYTNISVNGSLQQGNNVIACDVHLAVVYATTLRFDLSLIAVGVSAPTPSVTPTISPTISITPTISTSISITPTISISTSFSPTNSVSASVTSTISTSTSNTPSVSYSTSETSTTSISKSWTASVTGTPSAPPSGSPTISQSSSYNPTTSSSPTVSTTMSASSTPSVTVSPSNSSAVILGSPADSTKLVSVGVGVGIGAFVGGAVVAALLTVWWITGRKSGKSGKSGSDRKSGSTSPSSSSSSCWGNKRGVVTRLPLKRTPPASPESPKNTSGDETTPKKGSKKREKGQGKGSAQVSLPVVVDTSLSTSGTSSVAVGKKPKRQKSSKSKGRGEAEDANKQKKSKNRDGPVAVY